MRILNRILLLYSPVPLLVLGLVLAASLAGGAADRFEASNLEHHEQALKASEGLLATLRRMNEVEFDYTSGYPIPGHTPSSGMKGFDRLMPEFQRHLDAAQLGASRSSTQARLGRIAAQYQNFLRFDRQIRALVLAGRRREAERLNFMEAELAYDQLALALRNLIDENQQHFAATQAEATTRRHAIRRGLIAGGSLIVALTLLIGAGIARSMSLPIAELENAARRIQEGDYSARKPSGRLLGIREFRTLSAGFDAMTRAIASLTQRLTQDNARLETRVAERTATLEQARRELELSVAQLHSLDILKSQFVSTVSHELRTPLTSIMGFAEFLEDEIAGELSADQKVFVSQIQAGSRRLERLVDDLLDFSRLESGSFKLERQPRDLQELLASEIESLKPQAASAGLKLDFEADPSATLPVEIDAERIGQVITNLVSNAIKFTPAGGRITARARRLGACGEVSIEDTGRGIAPEHQARLFEKFYQVDNSSTREHGGTGLGLAICHALIRMHDGEIGMRSSPQTGSTFWFTLPLSGRARSGSSGGTSSAARRPSPPA